MEKPLISVIVPAYNVEKFIGKCIDSISRGRTVRQTILGGYVFGVGSSFVGIF